jgi:hypothetical protein
LNIALRKLCMILSITGSSNFWRSKSRLSGLARTRRRVQLPSFANHCWVEGPPRWKIEQANLVRMWREVVAEMGPLHPRLLREVQAGEEPVHFCLETYYGL